MVHKTHDQVWDTFLMSSRDGFHWTWVDRHDPFLGRGEVGTYDAGYMMPSGPILHDGRIWIYYSGFSAAHSANPSKLGEKDVITVALATLPEDRWAGLLAGPNQGRITTRPFTFKGSRLVVDVDASLPQSIPTETMNFDECEVRAALGRSLGGRDRGVHLRALQPHPEERPPRGNLGGGGPLPPAGRGRAPAPGNPQRLPLLFPVQGIDLPSSERVRPQEMRN